ncbi:MAG: hypothetical protein EOP85_22350 [Verrucomicrobiaceae bacterium]|nr:MAG: hypothetical protein EOP85_22350 [Verrucomicrobiaceae bacterium]
MASLEEQREEVRRTVILEQRQRATGNAFDELTLASGRTYRKVSVTAIDDAGVNVRHEDGSAKLRFEDLNASQRVLFGLEEDLAMAAVSREEQDAVAYEQWIDSRLVANNQAKEKAASELRQEASLKKSARLAAAVTAPVDLVSANTSTLSRPAKAVSRWRSSYKTYGPTYRYYSVPRYHYRSRTPIGPTMRPNRTSYGYYNSTACPTR